MSVGDIADALGISQPNASQHLSLLRDRGIVTAQRSGSTIYYALTSQKIVQAVDLPARVHGRGTRLAPARGAGTRRADGGVPREVAAPGGSFLTGRPGPGDGGEPERGRVQLGLHRPEQIEELSRVAGA